MNSEIARTACNLSEKMTEVALLKNDYEAAIEEMNAIKARLSANLSDVSLFETLAIELDCNETLIAGWDDGEHWFSLARTIS